MKLTKKKYEKPKMELFELKQQCCILTGSELEREDYEALELEW